MCEINETMSEKWWKISKEDEYKINNKLKSSDVKIIKDWLMKQTHLPQLNDNQIIVFIRASDCSLENTKELIDLNYTSRTRLPEYFSQRHLTGKTVEAAMEYLKIGFLPVRQNGNLVVNSGINPIDLSRFYVDEFIKYSLMIHDVSHLVYGSSEGYIYIMDMDNVTFNLLLRIPITSLIKSLKFWQFCSTYRIKGIHIVNGGPAFEKLFQMCSPFLSAEVIKMIKVHANHESLRNELDTNCIPSNYGGTAPTMEELNDEMQKNIKMFKDWFPEEEKQRVNEKKRLSPITNDLGLQGSFRKLDLD